MTHSCSPSRRSHDRVHAPHHWRGGDERERERGLKIGRSEIQSDLGGREGTAMLGTKMEAAALLLTPPTPEGRDPPSLRPKPNPKTEKLSRECGQTKSVVEDKQQACSTRASGAGKWEVGEV